jgi:RNA polymerase sigma-70 factor (ECF subfamily)
MATDDAIRPVESYRDYLLILAGLHRGLLARAGLDPSDLVQMTLMKAHRNAGQFRGTLACEQAAWMRRILMRTMIDEARRAAPRDVSLEAAFEESSLRLEAVLGDGRAAAGVAGEEEERLAALAAALPRLSDDQRRAIELRYLEGLSIEAISRRMERTTASVGGLLQRGLRQLRALIRVE